HLVRVLFRPEKVQHTHRDQSDRLLWIEYPGVDRPSPDVLDIQQVPWQYGVTVRIPLTFEHDSRVCDRDRLVVDIDTATRGIDLVGDFVDVADRRNPGTEIEELADSLLRHVLHTTTEELPADFGELGNDRERFHRLGTELAVDRPVRRTVEIPVVHPRRVRPFEIDPCQLVVLVVGWHAAPYRCASRLSLPILFRFSSTIVVTAGSDRVTGVACEDAVDRTLTRVGQCHQPIAVPRQGERTDDTHTRVPRDNQQRHEQRVPVEVGGTLYRGRGGAVRQPRSDGRVEVRLQHVRPGAAGG